MTVLVTGPHRSGTTFVTKCIAYDLGFEFVAEERVHCADRYLLQMYCEDSRDYVIQCPWAAPFIHQFANTGVSIVWVNRPHSEITASRDRMYKRDGTKMSWGLSEAGLRRSYNASRDSRDILTIQRDNWEDQRQMFSEWKEVDYHDYDNHLLHVDGRENFHFRQISEGEEIVKMPSLGDPIPCL